MKSHLTVLIIIYFIVTIDIISTEEGFCRPAHDASCGAESVKYTELNEATNIVYSPVSSDGDPEIFLIYDVNHGEGFNLRRDVYIRMVVFLKKLSSQPGYRNVRLVLPPFYFLYHWKSQSRDVVFWNHFFSMEHLRMYASVIDFWEYFDIMRQINSSNLGTKTTCQIDHVIALRHFDSMFSSGKFEDKFEIHECLETDLKLPEVYKDFYRNFTLSNTFRVEFQGSASLLRDVLMKLPQSKRKVTTVLILNAETVLHDNWNDREYWRARKSMRFNDELLAVADEFRKNTFHSLDDDENSNENNKKKLMGDHYICAHLRRGDFVHSRESTTPILRSAAEQLKFALKHTDLRDVFISSDCTGQEFHDLKSHLKRYRVVRFTPATGDQRLKLKDGGIAIVDQIVCSNARYFIGTYDSTFTYRIYEEREIMGFPEDSTFNTFCKSASQENCSKNTKWKMVN